MCFKSQSVQTFMIRTCYVWTGVCSCRLLQQQLTVTSPVISHPTNTCIVCLLISVLTWKTSSSSRRAPNTVIPLVSTSALLPRGRGRVIFFLQSSSSVTFFLETEKAMRCHLETRRRNGRRINVWCGYRSDLKRYRTNTHTHTHYSQSLTPTWPQKCHLNQSQTGCCWLLTCHQPGWRLWTVGSPQGLVCRSGPRTGKQVSVPVQCRAAGCPAHCRWRGGKLGDQPGP